MRHTLDLSHKGTSCVRNGLVILAAIVTLTSCASRREFDREGMRATLHHESAGATALNHRAPANEPAITVPFRLGLYFMQREAPKRSVVQRPDWVSADKDALRHMLAPVLDERIVTDLFLLTDSTVQRATVREIRQAATRYGADAMLIVDGAGAVNRSNNAYAALYPTLIGAYLMPGTESEALFMIEGTLWDVRAESVLATQDAEGMWKSVGPAMSVEDANTLARAKQAALAEFGTRIVERLRVLKKTLPRQADRSRGIEGPQQAQQ